MKKFLAIVASTTLASHLVAQSNTVATDPVGYITVNIAGTGGASSPAYTFLALSMLRESSYQGVLTGVGTRTLSDTNSVWVEDQFNGTNGSFTVEISTNLYEGYQTTISNTVATTKTIEIEDDFTGVASPGDSYKIYKNWTLASLFGVSNSSGIAGGNSTSADLVQIWNGVTYDSYYYQTSGIGGVGWRKTGTPLVDRKDTALFIEQGILIRRQAASSTNITVVGAVKVTPTVIPVDTNYTFVANVYPVDMTFASSQLYTGNPTNGVNGGSSTSADKVLLWKGNTSEAYYYQTTGIGGTGWRKGGFPLVNAGTNIIAGGTCFIVQRKLNLPFMWKAPKHPVP